MCKSTLVMDINNFRGPSKALIVVESYVYSTFDAEPESSPGNVFQSLHKLDGFEGGNAANSGKVIRVLFGTAVAAG